MNKRDKSIFIRVTQKEQNIIYNKAKKCGLSVSEYLRKMAFGHTPKTIPPDAFYPFYSRINMLYSLCSDKVSNKTEVELLKLIDDIRNEFLAEDRR
ncbi:MAG: hypothetical protein NC397_01135 [Clostridium sp.]|nr:hypothetical protein [Clostridium sp.]